MTTFPIPKVLVVRMSMKDAMVDAMFTKENIVDDRSVHNKENF